MPATRPLEGVKVLDFTIMQQGPSSTVLLSDMGAEIWKVEPVGTGEQGRNVLSEVPKAVNSGASRTVSSYFLALDRGKKSITLNLKNPKARGVALKLAEQCDAMVSNFRPGVMDRLGLGYEDVRAVNPTIVYASASAFGSQGKMRSKPGFDLVGQAMGGIMVSNQIANSIESPFPAGAAVGDQGGGMILAFGIVTALLGKQLHGVGQALDVSLYGSQIFLQSWEITQTSLSGLRPPRAYPGHNLVGGLYGSYDTADGSLVMVGVGEVRWPGFCRSMGLEELLEDPRFKVHKDREAHRAELVEIVRARLKEKTTKEWMPLLEANDIMCAPVQTYQEVLDDKQAWENGYITTLDYPDLGPIKVAGSPVRMNEMTVGPQGPPPEIGQHTEEILLEAGYTWDEVVALRDEGVN